MFAKFYVLSAPFSKKWFWGKVLSKIDTKVLAQKGMRDFNETVCIEIVEGSVPGDFLWVGLPILIVSSKVLEIWKRFATLDTYKVVLKGRGLSIKYSGAVFLGRGGPFEPEKSKAVYSKSLNEQGKQALMKHRGMYFDDSQWDGSNLFTIDDFPCLPIVTERVVKAMKDAKVTNCKYTPVEEYSIFK